MARGPVHRLALGSKQEQVATRAASVARIKELLADGPKTAAELAQVLAEELDVVRATVFGYLRHMHKTERSIRTAEDPRGRAAVWVLGADPALPPPSDAHERGFVEKRPRVPARQVGMQRHWMDVALFGPAREAA